MCRKNPGQNPRQNTEEGGNWFKGKPDAGVEPAVVSVFGRERQEIKSQGHLRLYSMRPGLATGNSVLKKQKSRMQKGDRCCTG